MQKSEIKAYAKQFREAFLRGTPSYRMCAALSGPLCSALNLLGVDAHLRAADMGGIEHIYLQLPDGTVLDPTADQIEGADARLPPVYLGPAVGLLYEASYPWPGGQEWPALMAHFRRLSPAFEAKVVGKMVGDVLRSMPPGSIDFMTP